MGRKFAILIGVETYDDLEIVPVAFAAADVLAKAEALKVVCRFDVVHRLCQGGDAAPTFNNISGLLEDLAKELREDDLLYFHGSAHGAEVEGRRYLLTQDTPRRRSRAAIPIADLHDWLDKCDALRRAFVLDICRDNPLKDRAGADNLMSDGLGRDIGTQASDRPGSGDPTVAILSACKPGQRAYGWDRVRRGLLSHFMIERIEHGRGRLRHAGRARHRRGRPLVRQGRHQKADALVQRRRPQAADHLERRDGKRHGVDAAAPRRRRSPSRPGWAALSRS